MLRRLGFLAALAFFVLPATALGAGGNYGFDGGTPRQQAQVRAALDASSFDWGLVRSRVTIHIGGTEESYATPGHVWLNADLLASGRFAWGVVQHEYAHQVDFLLLDDAARALLRERLGGDAWCYETPGLAHERYGCERFASTLAWAYWPSSDNSLRPTSAQDESAALAPAAFRSLLAEVLRTPSVATAPKTAKAKAPKRAKAAAGR